MPYSYWNRKSFSPLLQLSLLLLRDPVFARVAAYCRLREKGLRAEAFARLAVFLDEALVWSRQARLDASFRLLELHYTFPQERRFLCHPLLEEFIRPSLRIMAHPGNRAFRELALLDSFSGKGMPSLRMALRYAPWDNAIRGRTIAVLLRDIRHAMHLLGESRFIGHEAHCAELLCEAGDLFSGRAGDDSYLDLLYAEYRGLAALFDEWMAYKDQARDTAFPLWRRLHERSPSRPVPAAAYK